MSSIYHRISWLHDNISPLWICLKKSGVPHIFPYLFAYFTILQIWGCSQNSHSNKHEAVGKIQVYTSATKILPDFFQLPKLQKWRELVKIKDFTEKLPITKLETWENLHRMLRKTWWSWWFFEPPTHLKNMRKSNWSISPGFRGENKKYLKPPPSCSFQGFGLVHIFGIPKLVSQVFTPKNRWKSLKKTVEKIPDSKPFGVGFLGKKHLVGNQVPTETVWIPTSVGARVLTEGARKSDISDILSLTTVRPEV